MSDDNAPHKKQRSSKSGYRPSRDESGEQAASCVCTDDDAKQWSESDGKCSLM
ncbi:hypothetical protein ACHAWO_002838 [Cyclotella atomus]|uniref:Uncharacterized protein n=1 Tax=Cyclotella atomus TaxID=382360 RepID=A0ABD3NR82_9STRA